jgi:hypothetical protein
MPHQVNGNNPIPAQPIRPIGLGKIHFSHVTPFPWLNHKPGHFPVEERAAEFSLAEPKT